jgi:tRNA threonylcarbamoyladenosine biosynthesis protein TsaB
MSYLLHIDTSSNTASICLSDNEKIVELAFNESRNDHATWLHPAINDLLKKNGLTVGDLDAIAVSIGPGSYTGLRVSLSAAKGFCYALGIPLITVNTLKMIAHSVKAEAEEYICPLIDARRMEVFTALYDKNIVEINPPSALILDANSFSELLALNKILFCGNGSPKLKAVLNHSNASFSTAIANASHIAELSYVKFRNRDFADVSYTEPLYIKEFYSPAEKK